jgi:hypothetical protein
MEGNGFLIVKQLGQAHSLIGYLVAGAVDRIAVSECESILSHSRPNSAICATFRQQILAAAPSVSLSGALKWGATEFSAGEESDRNSLTVGQETNVAKRQLSAKDKVLYDEMSADFEATILQNMVSAFKVADEQPAIRRADFAAIDAADAKSQESKDNPFTAEYTSGYDFYSNLAREDDETAAKTQVALASIDVLTIKAKTGSFPASLPAGHIDPFDNKPLQYRRLGTGFEIYTVGPTGTFDGIMAHKTGWDDCFIYPAPPKRPVPPAILAFPN